MNIKDIDREYTANTYARFDVLFERGNGSLLYDEGGKEYIDFSSGIAVNSFGIANEAWTKAVTNQLCALQHTSNLFYSSPQALLSKTLCERTGMKKLFFSNSGAEANEGAIKAARKYSTDKNGGEEGHNTIITLKNSFHGRTVTTVSATGQDDFHKYFTPFTEGFVYAEPDNIESVRTLAEQNDCCAIMLELIQGEGGIHVLSREFVSAVAELCKEKDLLLIVDEVQTGNGRTGELYLYMSYGIFPDIVTTAKGLGGGLPIGAVMLGEKVRDTLDTGSHGSTFGGNPVCAAGALSILSMITDELLTEVSEKGDYIVRELSSVKGVKSISGKGLMLGIETEKDSKELVKLCLEKGLVCLTAKHKLRLLPALNIPFDILEKGICILKDILQS